MSAVLRIYALVGLPILAVAACYIWRPIARGGEPPTWKITRVLWTIIAVVLCVGIVIGIPVLPIILWRIWRRPPVAPGPIADRAARTIVAFGISLMVTMAVIATVSEGDGDYRSFETIRLHTRIFLALSLVPLSGPLVAILLTKRSAEKPKTDPLDEPI